MSLTELLLLCASLRSHPNIIKIFDHFEESKHFYLVTELIHGGELFERIVSKEFYTELEARELVKILLKAIGFIHDKGVVHRDLKPENLLLTSDSDDANIKIADFGLARRVGNCKGTVGSPMYVAPEVLLKQKYGKPVDVWGIGVIVYILLCGNPPFYEPEDRQKQFTFIKTGHYTFDSHNWKCVSAEAKDLIRKMLVVNTGERWTCKQLLEHPWFSIAELPATNLNSALVELKKFNARRKFRSAVQTIQTINRLSKLVSPKAKATADPGNCSGGSGGSNRGVGQVVQRSPSKRKQGSARKSPPCKRRKR
jgi:calcium/calmodulin-dependent protein kinase I